MGILSWLRRKPLSYTLKVIQVYEKLTHNNYISFD